MHKPTVHTMSDDALDATTVVDDVDDVIHAAEVDDVIGVVGAHEALPASPRNDLVAQWDADHDASSSSSSSSDDEDNDDDLSEESVAVRRGVPERYALRTDFGDEEGDDDDEAEPRHTAEERARLNEAAAQCRETTMPRHFLRPPYTQPDHTNDDLTFFITDMHATNSITNQWAQRARDGRLTEQERKPNYWSFYMRLFGVTSAGHSVCCYLSGFEPYLYVQVPSEFTMRDADRLLARICAQSGVKDFQLAGSTLTERVNLYGYTKMRPIPLLCVRFHNDRARRTFIWWLREHPTVNDYNPFKADVQPVYHVWDAMVTPLMQFVNTTDIAPCQWITLPRRQYTHHNPVTVEADKRRARTQIDVDAHWRAVRIDTERQEIPPLLIESWDGEMKRGAGDNHMPDPNEPADVCFQLGTSVWRFGDDELAHQHVHCVRPTAVLNPNVSISSYATEAEMLEGYLRFSRDHVDADVRFGFNTYGFDNQYLELRMQRHLQHLVPADANQSQYDRGLFEYGRVGNVRSVLKESFTSSTAHAGRTCYTLQPCFGRTNFDLYKYSSEEWGICRSLNFIGRKIVGETKHDLDYRAINRKYDQTAYDRGEVADYCARDTELPIKIVRKKELIVEKIEQARLYGVTLDTMFNRKQMVRCLSLLTRYAHKRGYVFPDNPRALVVDRDLRDPEHPLRRAGTVSAAEAEQREAQRSPHEAYLYDLMFGNDDREAAAAKAAIEAGQKPKRKTQKYEGAIVIQPRADFYDEPICTLDFSGLYPSIMRGWKLCYTTLVLDPALLDDPEVRPHVKTVKIRDLQQPDRSYTVHWMTNVPQPLTYEILTDLLEARGRAKKQLKAAKEAGDAFKATLYDMKQLALKLGCNSVYGFTGATVGSLPCLPIAATVTYYGRQMIMQTKEYIEKHAEGSEIIYGDSVTGDTPLYILYDGCLHIETIESIGALLQRDWTPWHGDKEQIETPDGVQVWSGSHFTRAVRFIRHRLAPHKQLWRVVTGIGVVDVTDDHSLLRRDEESNDVVCTVADVQVGVTRLSSTTDDRALYFQPGRRSPDMTPEHLVTRDYWIDKWREKVVRSKVEAARLWWLCNREGQMLLDAGSSLLDGRLRIKLWKVWQRDTYKEATVKKLVPLGHTTDFVYDVETQSHHFSVGPGDLLVHNTDSVMINFHKGTDRAAFEHAFVTGIRMAQEVSATFPPEVELAFEKVFNPYILWMKKKYAGLLFTKPDEPGVYKKKGVASVRGDKIPLVRRLTDQLITQMIEDASTQRAQRTLHDELQKVIDDKLPLEDFVVEKKLTRETSMYAAPPEHVQVVMAWQQRDPGRAPKSGSIVAYVIAFDKHARCKVPVDVAMFKANTHRYRLHIEHYLTRLVAETIGQIIDLPRFGREPYRIFDRYVREARARDMGAHMHKYSQRRELVVDDKAVIIAGSTDEYDLPQSRLKRQRERKKRERVLKDEARELNMNVKALKQHKQQRAANMGRFLKTSSTPSASGSGGGGGAMSAGT